MAIKIAVLLLSVFLPISSLFASEPLILKNTAAMPQIFTFKGYKYQIVDNFNDNESNVTIKYDFDNDGDIEWLIGFQVASNDDVKVPASFLVLGKYNKAKFIPIVILQGNDYFNKIQLEDINKDGMSEILFWSSGGAHYTSLGIYQYRKGKMKQIFSNGSACGVDFYNGSGSVTIKIGRAQLEKPNWSYASGDYLWEVWQWDGRKFAYNKKLSTSRLIREGEEINRFVKKYHAN